MGLDGAAGSDGRFLSYVEGLAGVIGHADRVNPLRDYCSGLMMPCERKSVEPLAAVTAPSRTSAQHQSLLHFVGQAAWSDEKVLAKVCETVLPTMTRHGLQRGELLEAVGKRYRQGGRKEKARILDEFAAVTGYHRKHAMRLLRGPGLSTRHR